MYCGKRAANGSTVFPCQSDLMLSESTSPISLLGLCFSSEGLHGARTTGSCLRLASCTALCSSALGATAAAWRLQLRNDSPGQDVMLMYWSFKGCVRKTVMTLQMGKLQIITPDTVLTLHQCVVLHGSGNAPTAGMDIWVSSSEVFTAHWNSLWVGYHTASAVLVNPDLTLLFPVIW